jgi:putative holliday junction resolvase
MPNSAIVALDVGDKRIGVAVSIAHSRLARPLKTIVHSGAVWDELQDIFTQHNTHEVVVGLPRGLDGQETQQTKKVRDFVEQLGRTLHVQVHLQDEALTSVRAKEELEARGAAYDPTEIDALAATYILEDYLRS